ncbi:MAG: YbjN domain-containing protein [Selenomonadaceae bacterium]|nr:YbjN domain-containing protein [Selenomonadaceae bacterium]
MDNYEALKDFMTNAGLHFSEGTLENGDKVFRIPQKIKNGGIVDVVLIFAESNIKLVVFGIATVEEEEKKPAYYKLFNELAAKYGFFKFYVRPNGDITLEGDIILGIVEGEFKPKALMGFMAAAITLLQDNYRDIMKIQWS